jgi:hypothetical protein
MKCGWLGTIVLLLLPGAVHGEPDPTSVKDDLDRARATYTAEFTEATQGIEDALTKRLTAARKAGNKQLIDAIENEAKAFHDLGEIPPPTPSALRRKITSLDSAMEKALAIAIRDFVKLGMAAEADAAEKERTEFHDKIALRQTRTTLMGKWTLKMTGGYTTDCTFYPDGTMFHSTANQVFTWELDAKKRLVLFCGPDGGGPARNREKIMLPLDVRGTKGLAVSGEAFTLTKKTR